MTGSKKASEETRPSRANESKWERFQGSHAEATTVAGKHKKTLVEL